MAPAGGLNPKAADLVSRLTGHIRVPRNMTMSSSGSATEGRQR